MLWSALSGHAGPVRERQTRGPDEPGSWGSVPSEAAVTGRPAARRIIFLNRFFFPDHSATSQILTDLALHLAGCGIEVRVVTSRQRYNDPDANLPEADSIGGVERYTGSLRPGSAGPPSLVVASTTHHFIRWLAVPFFRGRSPAMCW